MAAPGLAAQATAQPGGGLLAGTGVRRAMAPGLHALRPPARPFGPCSRRSRMPALRTRAEGGEGSSSKGGEGGEAAPTPRRRRNRRKKEEEAFTLEKLNPITMGRKSRQVFDDVWAQLQVRGRAAGASGKLRLARPCLAWGAPAREWRGAGLGACKGAWKRGGPPTAGRALPLLRRSAWAASAPPGGWPERWMTTGVRRLDTEAPALRLL